MDITTFEESKEIATEKWHEYNMALRKSGNPLYKDLAKVYAHVRQGKKVIDIRDVLNKGGMHENGHPKLAITLATAKICLCRLRWNEISYSTKGNCQVNNSIIIPRDVRGQGWIDLEAPVPLIPPKLLPDKLTDKHYILWEVDEWKMVAPTDPWLLYRITKTIFVALSAWDLTPLEKMVMNGRMA